MLCPLPLLSFCYYRSFLTALQALSTVTQMTPLCILLILITIPPQTHLNLVCNQLVHSCPIWRLSLLEAPRTLFILGPRSLCYCWFHWSEISLTFCYFLELFLNSKNQSTFSVLLDAQICHGSLTSYTSKNYWSSSDSKSVLLPPSFWSCINVYFVLARILLS